MVLWLAAERAPIPELIRPRTGPQPATNWKHGFKMEPVIVPATNTVVAAPVSSPAVVAELRAAQESLASGDLATAASRYESVLKQEPGHALALVNLGVIRYQQGDLDRSEAVLRRVPDDGAARAVLGIILFRRGKLDAALVELERAVALAPANAEAHNFLGIALSEVGKSAAAEAAVRRALELRPDYVDAHVNLALLYSRQEPPRLELARFHYRKARALGAPADVALEARLKL